MLLLVIFTVLFFIVIGMIMYANWPSYSSGRRCEEDDCDKPACGRCRQPKRSCRCPKKAGCDFC